MGGVGTRVVGGDVGVKGGEVGGVGGRVAVPHITRPELTGAWPS